MYNKTIQMFNSVLLKIFIEKRLSHLFWKEMKIKVFSIIN